MLLIDILLFVNYVIGKKYDCITTNPDGVVEFISQTQTMPTHCKEFDKIKNYSYLFTRDYTFSANVISCKSMTFEGSLSIINTGNHWINVSTVEFLENSQIEFHANLESNTEFIFGANSKVMWYGSLSFQRLVKFKTAPSLNQTQLVIWDSNMIHLYKPNTTSNGFEIINPRDNKQCFDVMSFNNNNSLDFDKNSDNHYLQKDFDKGLKMTYGIAYLLSNKKLMRFCPNGIILNKNIICTIISPDYLPPLYPGSNYPFNYPHCPCNDETECTLNIESSLKSVNFNMVNISNTILHIDHEITLYNFVSAKQINVDDNVKLIIGSVASNNEYSQMIKFNNFEITNIRKSGIRSQFKYSSTKIH
ncbi:protein kinase domain containing protein [Entamoeba nuttalli P19]|uniref:Protein kinase domain containing protein n=1 Tax=Entamoeba nuttalli (strain P19) TaxID=1076696 RepID=K2GQ55_ENTNP|nr:protein kinase domain containing protein [Entamoeba nuttalli P19]EKE37043.1 protein kinase domain containing protein [Entamoeba nuttalli P19]|eukprot:XP_008860622.1 protein kinase domain containing protein [Entamoeba nuttalli P19]